MKACLKTVLLFASLSLAQDCTIAAVDPPPNNVVCEVTGRLLVTKPGIRQFPTANFIKCRNLCLYDLNCKSFSFRKANKVCRILGTATTTAQVKPNSGGKFIFSNRNCYERSGVCKATNNHFKDTLLTGVYRPLGNNLGEQDARIRPWAVLYGPNASGSRAHQGSSEGGDQYLEVTVSGAESIGVFQRVLWQTTPTNPASFIILNFDSYTGPLGTDSDNGYTLLVTYRNVVLKTITLHPYADYYTVDDDTTQRAYGSQLVTGYGSEFLQALASDPDQSQERTFGVLIRGPAGSTSGESVASMRITSLIDG